jgi:hypothetical protein
MKQRLRKIGLVIRADSEGVVPNVARNRTIEAPWRDVVGSVKRSLLRKHGGSLHSLYLRGSIAVGTAVEGTSDLDLVAVLTDDASPEIAEWAARANLRVRKRYPFVTNVDVSSFRRADLLRFDDPRFAQVRLILSVMGKCIYGEDLCEKMPRMKIGSAPMTVAEALGANLERLDATLDRLRPDQVEALCRWIMKKMVRAGYELVMEKERAYTRDLYPCFVGFAKHHPSRAREMKRALVLAIDPTSNKKTVRTLLHTLGRWLVATRIKVAQRESI